MPALCVATNVEELYHTVIVETPLGLSFTAFRSLFSSSYAFILF
jgi:hypothetical protein